ncbi:MAG: metalloregulator ArsR/SmtB family transcription factor [Capsulimonadales bacterium]|nr:metalloregulator ArsR/SmtB family transcription factor [Capsulimonadales bacterium]
MADEPTLDLSAIFKALADPTRLAVFRCIRCCGPTCGYDTEQGTCCNAEGDDDRAGGVTACRIRCVVPCAPSTLTHHLNELRAAGLITTERQGRVVRCRVRPEALAGIAAFVSGK